MMGNFRCRRRAFILKNVVEIHATHFYFERMLGDSEFFSRKVIMGDMIQVCFSTMTGGISEGFWYNRTVD